MDRKNTPPESAVLFCLLVVLSILLVGCATGKKELASLETEMDMNATTCEVNQASFERQEGSLWNEAGQLNDLFIDPKARRVGDIVTISVVETSSASNQADTNTARNSSLSATLTNLLGLENNASFPKSSGFDPFGSISGSTNNSFKGTGTTNRKGSLAASITARVMRVFPNGNLEIIGKREITINNEKQIIALKGIVRPRDISSDNVVLSTYIADAKIVYTGSGVIDDRQQPGWFARVLDSAWPF